MARSSYVPKQKYTGTGSNDTYTFNFKITDNTQIEIVEMDTDGLTEIQRVRGDDVTYLTSVTFDAEAGGGTVVLAANLTASRTLILLLAEDAPLQEYEFKNKASFTLKRFENAIDEQAGAIQRQAFKASQMMRIHDMDDETSIDGQLPAGFASNTNKTIKVNSVGDGFDFGPSVATIEAAETEADAAAVSAAAALVSETNSDASETAAAASAVAAAASAASALGMWSDVSYKVFADSPLAVLSTDAARMFSIDCTSGNVVVNLPAISTLDLSTPWTTGFKKTDSTANTITINRSGTDTIDGGASIVLSSINQGVTIIPDADGSPDDWLSIKTGVAASSTLTVTANHTATLSNRFINCDAATGSNNITILLPPLAGNAGESFTVKRIDNDYGYDVDLDGDGSEPIDGTVTKNLWSQYDYIQVTANSAETSWDITGKHQQEISTSVEWTGGGTVTASGGETVADYDATALDDTHSMWDGGTADTITTAAPGRYLILMHEVSASSFDVLINTDMYVAIQVGGVSKAIGKHETVITGTNVITEMKTFTIESLAKGAVIRGIIYVEGVSTTNDWDRTAVAAQSFLKVIRLGD